MNKTCKWIVGALCALVLVTSTFAATNCAVAAKAPVAQTQVDNNWVLTLGGVGNTYTGDDTTSAFGADISVGYTGQWLLPIETGLRQSIGYNDGDWTLNTRVYNDWTLFTVTKLNLDVFAGGAIGLQYGDQKPSWEIAPEAGVRWWIKDDLAVVGRAEVPWDLAEWEFKDTVRYFLGFQTTF